MLFLVVVFGSLIVPLNCARRSDVNHTIPAVYYWKTSFSLSTFDKAVLDSLNVRKLYLRCFDVDWNAATRSAEVVAPLNISMPAPDSIEIIPTVFITNKVMLNIPRAAFPN